MSAQKRRVVYMDDETWESLRALATGQSLTMSEVLRRALRPPGNHIVSQEDGLVAEVAHLKRQLAKRREQRDTLAYALENPASVPGPTPGFAERAMTTVLTPVETPLRNKMADEARRSRQQVIDATLAKAFKSKDRKR